MFFFSQMFFFALTHYILDFFSCKPDAMGTAIYIFNSFCWTILYLLLLDKKTSDHWPYFCDHMCYLSDLITGVRTANLYTSWWLAHQNKMAPSAAWTWLSIIGRGWSSAWRVVWMSPGMVTKRCWSSSWSEESKTACCFIVGPYATSRWSTNVITSFLASNESKITFNFGLPLDMILVAMTEFNANTFLTCKCYIVSSITNKLVFLPVRLKLELYYKPTTLQNEWKLHHRYHGKY